MNHLCCPTSIIISAFIEKFKSFSKEFLREIIETYIPLHIKYLLNNIGTNNFLITSTIGSKIFKMRNILCIRWFMFSIDSNKFLKYFGSIRFVILVLKSISSFFDLKLTGMKKELILFLYLLHRKLLYKIQSQKFLGLQRLKMEEFS